MPSGRMLRVETLAPAIVHWSDDDWRTVQDAETRDPGLGIYYADLPTAVLSGGRRVLFTFYWLEAGQWEQKDFSVSIHA